MIVTVTLVVIIYCRTPTKLNLLDKFLKKRLRLVFVVDADLSLNLLTRFREVRAERHFWYKNVQRVLHLVELEELPNYFST